MTFYPFLKSEYLTTKILVEKFHFLYKKKTLNQILIEISFIGNFIFKTGSFSIQEFTIIKAFKAKLHLSKTLKSIKVIWKHTADGWLKCNKDNSFSTDMVLCDDLFINTLGNFVFGFLELLKQLMMPIISAGIVFGLKQILLLCFWLPRSLSLSLGLLGQSFDLIV